MNRSATILIVITAISSAILFTNLGGPRLWDRDEPRNASCAAEMLKRKDWVVPVMNAELRTHKPVMLYWVTMLAYSVGGVNEFTARFGSALAGVGSVLLTYVIGKRIFSRKAGFWGAIALATMMMFNVAARAATPDSLLIFFIVATLAAFTYAVTWTEAPFNVDVQRSVFTQLPLGFAALMYLAAAGAVLTKGPVGVILPLAVAGGYLMAIGYKFSPTTEQNWKALLRRAASAVMQTPGRFFASLWQLRPIMGAAIVAAVAVPWYVWVGIRTQGAWPSGFFLEHNLNRFSDSMEGHGGSIFYYPVALLIGAFPWSTLLIPTFLLLRKDWPAEHRRGIAFCMCWVGVIVGLFSLAQTKLPSYITPCYPGLALAAGWFLSRITEPVAATARQWTIASGAVLILAGTGVFIALPIASSIYLPGENVLALIGVIPFVGGIAVIYAARRGATWTAPALATCAAALMLGCFAFGADRVDAHRHHEKLFSAIHSEDKGIPIAVWGVLEPSWVFYSHRPLEVVETRPTSRRVRPTADGKWQSQIVETPDAFLKQHPDGILITTRKLWEKQQSVWDNELVEIAEAPYFLKQDELIALQTRQSVAAKSQKNPKR